MGVLGAVLLGTGVGVWAGGRESSPHEALVSKGFERRTVHFEGATFEVVSIEWEKVELRLVREDERGQGVRTFAELKALVERRGERLLAATNAGIFEPGEVPTGLFIQDGRVIAPLNLGTGQPNFYWLPNGVFSLGPRGATVVESTRFHPEGVRQATQSGPLLLHEGQVHPDFAASQSLRTRSGVGVDASHPQLVHIVLSRDPVRMWTLAELFRTRLGCTDALYLDGAISQLYPFSTDRPSPEETARFSGFLTVTSRGH